MAYDSYNALFWKGGWVCFFFQTILKCCEKIKHSWRIFLSWIGVQNLSLKRNHISLKTGKITPNKSQIDKTMRYYPQFLHGNTTLSPHHKSQNCENVWVLNLSCLISKNGQTHFKNIAACCKYLKCVWPFWDTLYSLYGWVLSMPTGQKCLNPPSLPDEIL